MPRRILARPIGVVLRHRDRVELQRKYKETALQRLLGEHAVIERIEWRIGPYGKWHLRLGQTVGATKAASVAVSTVLRAEDEVTWA